MKNKSITFDKEAHDNLPQEIKDKMKSDREKARKEQNSKGLTIPIVKPRFELIDKNSKCQSVKWLLEAPNRACESNGNSDAIKFIIEKYNEMAQKLNEA